MEAIGKSGEQTLLKSQDSVADLNIDPLFTVANGNVVNPIHWVNLLNSSEQNGGDNPSKISTQQNGISLKQSSQQDALAAKNQNEISSLVKSYQNLTHHLSPLKFPEESVAAFTQAAGKVNGQREKCMSVMPQHPATVASGWPLLSKVQMIKCEKCALEFCSSINHRRHIRVHRRLFSAKKDDLGKKRTDLMEFWDKLTEEEAKQILSLMDMMLEGVSGDSIVKIASSYIRNPGFPTLPHSYIKAGAALLDIIQGKSSSFPITATDLFSILDVVSEKTFLCVGTVASVKKFVFGLEGGNICLEGRNLAASMCFLFEQSLENAWLVNKDAEALHYQNLLFEEEEAAEKKRTEQLEKRHKKKLKQKGQRVKGECNSSPTEERIVSTDDSWPNQEVELDFSNFQLPDGSHDTDRDSGASAQSSIAEIQVFPELDDIDNKETEKIVPRCKPMDTHSPKQFINCLRTESPESRLCTIRKQNENGSTQKTEKKMRTSSRVWTRKKHHSSVNSANKAVLKDESHSTFADEGHDADLQENHQSCPMTTHCDSINNKITSNSYLNDIQEKSEMFGQTHASIGTEALFIGTMPICLKSPMNVIFKVDDLVQSNKENFRAPHDNLCTNLSIEHSTENLMALNASIDASFSDKNSASVDENINENIDDPKSSDICGLQDPHNSPLRKAVKDKDQEEMKQKLRLEAAFAFLTQRWQNTIRCNDEDIEVFSDPPPSQQDANGGSLLSPKIDRNCDVITTSHSLLQSKDNGGSTELQEREIFSEYIANSVSKKLPKVKSSEKKS